MARLGTEDLDDSALSELPIFPLPNVVLLPGGLLPLHVFEQRYRDMTRDVLEGRGLIGVARLKPGAAADDHGRPAVHDICGVGRVIACDRLEDGRYNLLLRGLARARIERELPPAQRYRKVRATLLRDDCGRPEGLAAAHQQLIVLCDRLSLTIDPGGQQLRELVRAANSPGACADVVAAALIADADGRQALLEACDPCQRLAMTVDYVGKLLVDMGAPPGGLPN